jgi:hypothetical protein
MTVLIVTRSGTDDLSYYSDEDSKFSDTSIDSISENHDDDDGSDDGNHSGISSFCLISHLLIFLVNDATDTHIQLIITFPENFPIEKKLQFHIEGLNQFVSDV